jgi:GNAT superfamily N-acetyltransferase
MSDALRGRGIGNRLIDAAIEFCRKRAYPLVYLWTFEGLNPARHLYETVGFELVEQHNGRQWGKKVNEQRFNPRLK